MLRLGGPHLEDPDRVRVGVGDVDDVRAAAGRGQLVQSAKKNGYDVIAVAGRGPHRSHQGVCHGRYFFSESQWPEKLTAWSRIAVVP